LDTAPSETVECSKEELVGMFEMMYTMRRMEITCDNEYKARTIRGFCHLYDGQEAVATGIQHALDRLDSWATSYRCHCVALIRGGSVASVVAELFGRVDGISGGKGGSMHMYNKEEKFFGGAGIVGAQVPLGAGSAFANKYNAKPGEPMNVSIACYGDGAANQGQIWESANMCSLWKLVRKKHTQDKQTINDESIAGGISQSVSHLAIHSQRFLSRFVWNVCVAHDLLHRKQSLRYGYFDGPSLFHY
jgi:pyruvate dehydrogenase E1 component alpha subunit